MTKINDAVETIRAFRSKPDALGATTTTFCVGDQAFWPSREIWRALSTIPAGVDLNLYMLARYSEYPTNLNRELNLWANPPLTCEHILPEVLQQALQERRVT